MAEGGTKLVIVESPAKARTISGFLGRGYVVESSIGHIRDLPNNASEVPAKYKGESWGRLGVNVDDGFTPVYVVPADKKKQITKLKSLLKDADELYLATDEDREGEAIAWHLLDELKPKVPVHRMVFHEITPDAIAEAVANPRDINDDLVEAQEARRILDRLYGYEVSPVLWKKVMSGLSAGRVQSVATRLVVDRERERMAFRAASYWDLEATFDAGEAKTPRTFPAKLTGVDGRRVAQGRDFTSVGELKDGARRRPPRRGRAPARSPTRLRDQRVRGHVGRVASRTAARRTRRSGRPRCSRRRRASSATASARTMQIAQRLYENGYITYMRTDSVTLSGTAITRGAGPGRASSTAREYLPDAPRTYQSKVKNAQEAHEAIRPAGDSFRTPAQTGLNGDDFRLYELIWMRTVASQMRDAEGRSVSVRIGATAATGESLRVLRERPGHHVPRLPQGVRRGRRRPRRRARRPRDAAARPRRGRRVAVAELGVGRARDAAAGPLHRGHPDPRARGARDRPAVDVRVDHRHDPQPRLRLQEGHRAGAGLAGVRGRPAARAALRPAGRLQLHRRAWRTCSTRSPPAAATPTAELAEFYFGNGDHEGLKRLVTELGEIDARELSTFELGDGIAVRVGRYGPYVETPTATGPTCPTTCRPTSSRSRRRASCSPTRPARRCELGADPSTGRRSSPRTAATGRTSPRCSARTRRRAPSRAPRRCSRRCRSTRSRSTTRCGC